MKTSTEIGSLLDAVTFERAIELVAKAGFDAWYFSMFPLVSYDKKTDTVIKKDMRFCGDGYIEFAKELRRVGEKHGIYCNQAHAPFPSVPKMMPYIRRAIECTAAAGGKICVVHPWNDATPEENAQMYRELLPLAKSLGVKIATENMWNWDIEREVAAEAACSLPDNFNEHLDLVNDGDLVACLDLGHAEMFQDRTSAPEMIRALGPRLKALHIHDNDRRHDSHAIPFTMDIDFGEIIDALREIGYSGDFTLEADGYVLKREEEVPPHLEKLYSAITRFCRMFEEMA